MHIHIYIYMYAYICIYIYIYNHVLHVWSCIIHVWSCMYTYHEYMIYYIMLYVLHHSLLTKKEKTICEVALWHEVQRLSRDPEKFKASSRLAYLAIWHHRAMPRFGTETDGQMMKKLMGALLLQLASSKNNACHASPTRKMMDTSTHFNLRVLSTGGNSWKAIKWG